MRDPLIRDPRLGPEPQPDPNLPDPSIIQYGNGTYWCCPVCGRSTGDFGTMKARLPGWRPWKRLVHTYCYETVMAQESG